MDIKGDAAAVKKFCKGINVERVWALTKLAHEQGVHVEVTTLVIPTVNDSDAVLREIAGRIVHESSPEVPWHVSQYYPAYEFTASLTPTRTLERAWQIGKEVGLEFVYVGNLPGHGRDNTYSPTCNAILIRRLGLDEIVNDVTRGKCPHCGEKVAGMWN